MGRRVLLRCRPRHGHQRAQRAREQWVSVEPQNTKGLPFYYTRDFELHGQRPEWGTASEERRVSLRLMRRLDLHWLERATAHSSQELLAAIAIAKARAG